MEITNRKSPPSIEAKETSAPVRVLFIGNSFTSFHDMPGMLERLAAAATPARTIQTRRVTVGGMNLRFHLNKGDAKKAIAEAKWDYVVLQEQSTLPLENRERMHESIVEFDAKIRAAGACTVLYLTWARRNESERQAELSDAYISIGQKLGCLIAPVGVAWRDALAAYPDLILHDTDDKHPNLAGSFLAACVFFATLFPNIEMRSLPPAAIPAELSPARAGQLYEIAIETVRGFN